MQIVICKNVFIILRAENPNAKAEGMNAASSKSKQNFCKEELSSGLFGESSTDSYTVMYSDSHTESPLF